MQCGTLGLRPSARAIPAMVLVLATGCGLPLDSEGTLERVRGGTMRVGVVHHPPWVDVRGKGGLKGSEVDLVRRLADEFGAQVEWSIGGESELMHELQRHRLDLVIGGIPEQSVWKARIGRSRPHDHDGAQAIILACPPGENGWLLQLDRWIARQATLEEGGS